jgi:AraC-like DNA-binding protein
MKCLTQYEPLVVEAFEAATWERPQPLRDHFTLVSIRQGSGTYNANNQQSKYQAGTLLLLGPADCYQFTIDQPTRFGQLRFTGAYLASLTASGAHAAAWQQVRHVAQHAALGQTGCFNSEGPEAPQLSALLTILFAECGTSQPGRDTLTASLMGAVLSLLGRQLVLRPLPGRLPSYAAGVVQRLLAYIRQHIAEPGRLRVEDLASAFAYSPSHLSDLFRKETGESLRQYIVRYRLWLAETQLKLGTLTIAQIADELGFVDGCHLNKLFKKRYQLTPTEYRRQLAMAATY